MSCFFEVFTLFSGYTHETSTWVIVVIADLFLFDKARARAIFFKALVVNYGTM
jgi:hypothetical protein